MILILYGQRVTLLSCFKISNSNKIIPGLTQPFMSTIILLKK